MSVRRAGPRPASPAGAESRLAAATRIGFALHVAEGSLDVGAGAHGGKFTAVSFKDVDAEVKRRQELHADAVDRYADKAKGVQVARNKESNVWRKALQARLDLAEAEAKLASADDKDKKALSAKRDKRAAFRGQTAGALVAATEMRRQSLVQLSAASAAIDPAWAKLEQANDARDKVMEERRKEVDRAAPE